MKNSNGSTSTAKSASEAVRRALARREFRESPEMVRALRRRAGLALVDVADALGVEQSSVCRWERGDRVPRGEAAVAYLELLRAATEGDAP